VLNCISTNGTSNAIDLMIDDDTSLFPFGAKMCDIAAVRTRYFPAPKRMRLTIPEGK
jgi:hypothetical protein